MDCWREIGTMVENRCCAKSPQMCLTQQPMGCCPPGSSVHGILKARNWSGLPFPSPEDLTNPRIKPTSFMSPALAGSFLNTSATWTTAQNSIFIEKKRNNCYDFSLSLPYNLLSTSPNGGSRKKLILELRKCIECASSQGYRTKQHRRKYRISVEFFEFWKGNEKKLIIIIHSARIFHLFLESTHTHTHIQWELFCF